MHEYSDLPPIWQYEIAVGSAFGQRVVAAMASNPKRNRGVIHKQVPSISDVGTRIQNAIEQAAEFRFTCGHCVAYLRSLNHQSEHDAEAITRKLIHELQLPIDVRQRIGNTAAVMQWIRGIVESIMGIK